MTTAWIFRLAHNWTINKKWKRLSFVKHEPTCNSSWWRQAVMEMAAQECLTTNERSIWASTTIKICKKFGNVAENTRQSQGGNKTSCETDWRECWECNRLFRVLKTFAFFFWLMLDTKYRLRFSILNFIFAQRKKIQNKPSETRELECFFRDWMSLVITNSQKCYSYYFYVIYIISISNHFPCDNFPMNSSALSR
jgi:hypothetical protein